MKVYLKMCLTCCDGCMSVGISLYMAVNILKRVNNNMDEPKEWCLNDPKLRLNKAYRVKQSLIRRII